MSEEDLWGPAELESGQDLGVGFWRLADQVRNWYTAGLLASVVLPTRVPPRAGLPGTWLGRRPITFRMRDGSSISCRLQDAEAVVSIQVREDYNLPSIDWRSLRTIVDVGAHVGAFAVWAGKRSSLARIIAVEPNPHVHRYLLDNVNRNGLGGRTTLVRAALGGEAGQACLEVREFSVDTKLASGAGSGPVVKLETLSRLMASSQIEELDLLKMDCEGAEFDVLLNAPGDLFRRIRTIVCEWHPSPSHDPAELYGHLARLGFHVETAATRRDMLVASRHSQPLAAL